MDAVSRWLVRVAAERGPVVVVLDDLQWADGSSLALLEFVARDPAPAAVALIGCYRHDELDAAGAAPPVPTGDGRPAPIELGGARPGGGRGARHRRSPVGSARSEVDVLFRRAGGHPVFTRELALLAREGRDAASSRWRCATPSTAGSPDCPRGPGRCWRWRRSPATPSTPTWSPRPPACPEPRSTTLVAAARSPAIVTVDAADRLPLLPRPVPRDDRRGDPRGSAGRGAPAARRSPSSERAARGLPVHPG